MATYSELYAVSGNSTLPTLEKQIMVALMIKANAIAKLASPTAPQKEFARTALGDPSIYRQTVMNYILAEYNTATVATIAAATDTQVQTAVNSAVDTLLGV
mgnify:CR=1 FL=1